MEKKSQISAYEKEFPGWKIGKFLGRGSGGNTVVYEIYYKLVDCLEKCLIYGHIRRFAD